MRGEKVLKKPITKNVSQDEVVGAAFSGGALVRMME